MDLPEGPSLDPLAHDTGPASELCEPALSSKAVE
jgi:hypothetical protein